MTDESNKLKTVIDCLAYVVNNLFQNQLMAEDNAKELMDVLYNLNHPK